MSRAKKFKVADGLKLVKKPKPARVWTHDPNGPQYYLNGKYAFHYHPGYMVKILNRLERKIARLEGR